MMKVLLIDNYDSFTFNLAELLQRVGVSKLTVLRNDKITVEEADAFDAIVLSPGPGLPSESGVMPDLIKEYGSSKRFLGVCLGHQAIAESFGAELENLSQVMHGKESSLKLLCREHYFLAGLPEVLSVGRYHSWSVKRSSLPDCLELLAEDESGQVMAIAHKSYDLCGVQFHPESVLTPQGDTLISNWFRGAGV